MTPYTGFACDAATASPYDSHLTRLALAHEYFHVLQFQLAGTMHSRVPSWLTEGTALWSEHILFEGLEPHFDHLQASTNHLDLASPPAPSVYVHNIGFAAVAMLVERAGPESIVRVWESLGQAAQEEQDWTTGFARAFDVSYPEFLTEFRERRSPLFGTIRGRVRATDNQSLPRMHVWATGDSPIAFYSAEVSSDGQFELTLLRLEPETAKPIRYALAISPDHSWCEVGLRLDGTPTFPVLTADQGGFMVPPHGEPAQPLDIQLPASFCRDRLVLQLTGEYGVSGTFWAEFCIAGTSDCILAHHLSEDRFEVYVPIEADYWIRVTDHAGPCSMYVGADGHSPDPEQALRIASSENPGLIEVRLDSASDSCVSGSR